MDEEERSVINFEANHQSAEHATDMRVRCEHCGMNFNGEAWEFSPSTRTAETSSLLGMPRWLVAVIVVATLLAFLSAYL